MSKILSSLTKLLASWGKKLVQILKGCVAFVIIFLPNILTTIFVLVSMFAGGTLAFNYFEFAVAEGMLVWAQWAWPICWTIYLIGILPSAFLFAMYDFSMHCVGLNSFTEHMKHSGFLVHLETLIGGIFWPYGWFAINISLFRIYLDWVYIFSSTYEYWFVIRRKGAQFEVIDTDTMTATTQRVKPENVGATFINNI